MSDLGAITLAILVTFVGAEIGKKFKYPRVIGQLVISFVLAIPAIKVLFPEASIEVIGILAELGVIFLLLLTGFELNLKEFQKNKKDAAIIAFSAAVIPFLFGFSLGMWMGYEWKTSLVIGACMAVTAEGTTVALLLEMKQMKTKLASIILGAGIIDDAFEIIFLTLIFFLANTHGAGDAVNNQSFWEVVGKYELFIIGIWWAFRLVPKWIDKVKHKHTKVSLLSSMITVGMLVAFFSEFVGIGAVFGAFIAGLILQKSFFDPKTREKDVQDLRIFVFAFIVPFFFVNIGLNFDYNAVINNPQLTIAILVLAILGKIIGTLITHPFVSLSFKQLHLVGWGLNSRGVMELVLAHIALDAGLITIELYSAIVFMAITTTLLFPFIFKFILERNPNIMNEDFFQEKKKIKHKSKSKTEHKKKHKKETKKVSHKKLVKTSKKKVSKTSKKNKK